MLDRWHRLWAYIVLTFLFITGLAHYVLHGWFAVPGAFGPAPNPLEPWMLKLHGAAAMLGLIVFGSLLSGHIHRFWRLARNRRAGGIFLACALLLIGSGYGLYYFGDDQMRTVTRQVHIAVGILALPAFLLHLWRGRMLRRHGRKHRHERGRPQSSNPPPG